MFKFPSRDGPRPPLHGWRIGVLINALIWCVLAAAFGLSALVKADHDKEELLRAVSPPAVVTINTQDFLIPGKLTTVACFLVIALALISVPYTIFRPRQTLGSLTFQAVGLLSLSIWLLATTIAESIIFANRRARITVFVDGQVAPNSDQLVQTALTALGLTNVYRRIQYLRLAIVFPWFAFVATGLATVLFLAVLIEYRQDEPDPDARTPYGFSSSKKTGSRGSKPKLNDDGITEVPNGEKAPVAFDSSAPITGAVPQSASGVADRNGIQEQRVD
ncbi:hypothetical protein NLJ89_g3996 [Agrocybe chaxingu]|uniref:Uncharacterized protein n=1 Tax=Agrocybe chaxingu TaxID=84603 RepID=A0A9W8MWC4_9AGAR|nr:hypothetical protein NLJ89_g3996 [Agrocybe chaxingu]